MDFRRKKHTSCRTEHNYGSTVKNEVKIRCYTKSNDQQHKIRITGVLYILYSPLNMLTQFPGKRIYREYIQICPIYSTNFTVKVRWNCTKASHADLLLPHTAIWIFTLSRENLEKLVIKLE